MKMSFIYLGLPLGALFLAQRGFVPEAVIVPPIDTPGLHRLRSKLGSLGTLLLFHPPLESKSMLELLGSLPAQVLVSWYYTRKIPKSLLHMFQEAVGVHPSLLPKWRGPDPIYWALRAGDSETGVTLHRLEAEYDTGAILQSSHVPIASEDNAWSLARKLDRLGLELLADYLENVREGHSFKGVTQKSSLATLARTPSQEDLRIVWEQPVENIQRAIRAASPEPGAYTTLNETEVEVLQTEIAANPPKLSLNPSEAFVDQRGVFVRALDGTIRLVKIRLPDGTVLRNAEIANLFDR